MSSSTRPPEILSSIALIDKFSSTMLILNLVISYDKNLYPYTSGNSFNSCKAK